MEIYKKRLKSFAWRLGMVTLAFACTYIAEHIGDLELPYQSSIVIGLIFGEVSKYLNTK